MLAVVERSGDGYTARFERHWNHPVDAVWSFLTDNDKLKLWFDALHIEDLREGGIITFDMQDGTFEELKITEFKRQAVLAYTWGEDQVRFELTSESAGCQLVLVETIQELTSHTSKDLAGWHVCLDGIKALLVGRAIEARQAEWEKWHKAYAQCLEQLQA